MALNISTYTDPGVYVGEVVVPGSASVSTVPLTVCLIGIGNRNKRVNNEAVTRGLVSDETLVVASTPSAHDATLINRSNRKTAQLTVTKDGVVLDSANTTFTPANIVGTSLTTLNFTTNNKIALSFDGKTSVTIALVGGGGDNTTIAGNLITQRLASIADISAVTPTIIVEGINKALAGATTLGYGSAYGAVATLDTDKVVLTSPLSTPASDIHLLTAHPAEHSQAVVIFGGSVPRHAASVVRITNADYDSASVYKASYVAVDTDQDVLSGSNVQNVVRVGTYAGVTSFKLNTDFSRSGSNLDWSIDTAAVLTSSMSAATHDISTNDRMILSLDGKAAVTIDLNAMASPPPDYTNPADAAAATPTEIARNINAVLANTSQYGPTYAGVASVVGGTTLRLTSPTQGIGSIIEIGAPTTLSAVTALFGLSSTQLPYSVYGVGARPVAGSMYFATYEYTRATTDYNSPKRFFTPDSLYADVGYPSATNKLAIGASICFENKAPAVMVVQVNDSNFPGSPTQTEFKTALDAAATTSVATEIVILDSRLGVQVDLMDHVISQSSATEKNYRRGWFGMPRSTTIGDKDTADTFIYRAVRTLQVPGDSPGRGRMILVAPYGATRTVTYEDGSVHDIDLDGSFIAAAVAAKMTSFTSPSDTLLRKTVTGFKIDNFPTYLKGERALLASNGVTVVTLDAGKLVLTDPVTTEAGGGRLVTFQEISASTQKDAVVQAVVQAVDANLVGVVPSDLSTFILSIKGFLAGVLNAMITSGAIAPFKSESGITRDIDMAQDIQVFQDVNDVTKYHFRYYFNLRLPAKRFMGEYSVNSPFFA